jgi:hypothetical protein
MSIGTGFVFEGDLYLIARDSDVARQIIYRLHQNQVIPVIFAPFETTDQRPAGAVVSGTTPVIGWAFADAVNVSKAEVLVDGRETKAGTFILFLIFDLKITTWHLTRFLMDVGKPETIQKRGSSLGDEIGPPVSHWGPW